MLESISMASELMLVPPVAFELSDTEAAAAFVVPATQRTLLLGVFGANIALHIIDAVLATGFLRPGHANPLLASMHFITAALFVGAIFAFWRRAKPRKQRAWAVSFDDAGIHLGNNAGPPRTVPWRAIRSVNDTGTVIVLQYGVWRSAIIPRRAYADEGAALWLLLQQKLIGSRSLHRRADARIIVNTAAR
jgi:hypothetical protein